MESMPKGKLTYRRGEIRWVRLDPTMTSGRSQTIGAEAQKTRACLIVQMDTINQYGLLTIVIPFLPGRKKAPYVVNIIATEANGLDHDRYLDLGQVRAVSYERILGLVGKLETHYWQQVREAFEVVMGFSE
jgi:mRNA interferase MazF